MRKSLRVLLSVMCAGTLLTFVARTAFADAIILPEDEALGAATESEVEPQPDPEAGPEPDAWTYQDDDHDGQPDEQDEPQQDGQAEEDGSPQGEQDGQSDTAADQDASTTSKTGSEADEAQPGDDGGEPVVLDGPGMVRDDSGLLVLLIPTIAIAAVLAAFIIVKLNRKDGSTRRPSHLK